MIYRIVVVGAGAVGKSALTIRFIKGTFASNYDPTIEDSYRKQVDVDNKPCIIDIMDTAGQEEYSALRDQYMKTGDGFVVGYSIISRNSFEQATKLKTIICRVKDDVTDIPMMLIGNKCDLEDKREVALDEGKNMAAQWKVGFLESSAKLNRNVNEMFIELVRLIDKWRENNPSSVPADQSPSKDKKKWSMGCVLI